jgi:hypothetical protein
MKSATIAVSPHVAEWTLQGLARLTGTWAVVIGVSILFGGERRFSGPSYTYALQLPGAPPSWGVWILVGGLLVVAASLQGQRVMLFAALLVCALWSLSFATCTFLSLLDINDAGGTGTPTYLYIGVLSIFLAAAYRMKPAVKL